MCIVFFDITCNNLSTLSEKQSEVHIYCLLFVMMFRFDSQIIHFSITGFMCALYGLLMFEAMFIAMLQSCRGALSSCSCSFFFFPEFFWEWDEISMQALPCLFVWLRVKFFEIAICKKADSLVCHVSISIITWKPIAQFSNRSRSFCFSLMERMFKWNKLKVLLDETFKIVAGSISLVWAMFPLFALRERMRTSRTKWVRRGVSVCNKEKRKKHSK